MAKPQNENRMFEESVDLILNECRQSLGRIDPAAVEKLLEAVLGAEKIFFIGVGRVMLSLMAMAKRLSHLGIHACIVGEITEPAMTNRDILIIGSGSGESLIPVAIGKKAKSLGARIVHIGSNPESSLKPLTDIFIRVPVRTKLARPDEIDSHQPMTSLFEQSLLLFGDALAHMILKRKNLDIKSLWQFHANLE
jgi:6-phospho-3-hexuloisomerase